MTLNKQATLALYEGKHVPGQGSVRGAEGMANRNFDFLQTSILNRLNRSEQGPAVPLFSEIEESLHPSVWNQMYLTVCGNTVLRFSRAHYANTAALEEHLEQFPWFGSEAQQVLEAVQALRASRSARDYFSLSLEMRNAGSVREVERTLRGYLTYGYSPMLRTTIPELIQAHKTGRIMENLGLASAARS